MSESTACTVVVIENTDYAVIQLRPDASVASKAFRLTKLNGDGTNYDVRVDQYGPQCECLGFLRWSKPCKHILVLREVGLIP